LHTKFVAHLENAQFAKNMPDFIMTALLHVILKTVLE